MSLFPAYSAVDSIPTDTEVSNSISGKHLFDSTTSIVYILLAVHCMAR